MAIGVTEEQFWRMNPKRLKPYVDADSIRQEQRDEEMWRQGSYIFIAVRAAVSNVILGRKSHDKYIEKPFYQQAKEQKAVEMDAKEKEDKVKAVFMALEIHKFNSDMEKRIAAEETLSP